MLFQSDYWLASNYSEKLETIRQFLDMDAGIKTFVIIDRNLTDDTKGIIETLKADCSLPHTVHLVIDKATNHYASDEADGHTKTIHVRISLDAETIQLLREEMPILALFT
jgi:hypothetical protein